MLSDFLREVLLLRQGARVSEDALIIFEIPKPSKGIYEVIDWEEYLKYEVKPGNYIFQQAIKQTFIDKATASLRIIERLRPLLGLDQFCRDDFNRNDLDCKTATLSTVTKMLGEHVPDQSLFVEYW
jgi:hypothetical protein